MSDIKDINLAASGWDKINWVKSYMPVLSRINKEFEQTKPFAGKKISMSIHLEAKTAYLALTLKAGGADVRVTGCNPLSTQDDVAAALASDGFEVNARHGVDEDTYTEHLKRTLAFCPDLMIDDGGDLTNLLHGECSGYRVNLLGGGEETTTGIHRLFARQARGELCFPMIDVNDADCKHLFDNRYGTGQSTLDGIMNSTNLVIAGKNVVVAGYGWCGKGVAMRAKGLGAHVIVTEVDPIKAIEAVFDGFDVKPMVEAAPYGDYFVTVTGDIHVINKDAFLAMKDGAICANAGHFDVEVNKEDLKEISVSHFEARKNIEGYVLPDGRTIYLMAEGRLVNLAAGDGHPAEIMDLSFAMQALAADYICRHEKELKPGLYVLPHELDVKVAQIKLSSMGYSIDSLTEEQKAYLGLK